MASYTIPSGAVGVHDKVLVAATADSVTIVDAVQRVEVAADGSAAVYATVDGTTPTVSGSHCYEIPVGAASSITIQLPNETANAAVQLISSGTPVYSVAVAGSSWRP